MTDPLRGQYWQAYGGHSPDVHPTAYVHPTAVLIGQVRVGAESTIWPNTTLRGDDGEIIIGARSSVQDGAVIHTTEGLSQTIVGDHVTIGHNVTLHGARVADHCIIGMGSTLLDNAEIGPYCLVGAATLITQKKVIPSHHLVLGSPGRPVRRLNDKELEWIEYSWRRYVEQGKRYKANT